MKKIFLCLLLGLMVCGCQSKTNEPLGNEVGNETGNVVVNENETPDVVPTETLADKYAMVFKEVSTAEGEELTTENIANKLVAENLTEATLVVDPVEEGPLAGFTVDITGFKSAHKFSPMIGTIPFVAYVFETEDVESLVNLLNENHDLRWNICTEAENYSISTTDNFVFVIMCSDAQA